jgi:hypothetical protein
MEMLFSIITLVGMGYAVFVGVRWMLKAGQIAQKREQPLAPTDLKVLEESAARLMADLKAAADECVSRVELALAEAEHRIASLDVRQPAGIACQEPAGPTSTIEVATPVLASNPYGALDSAEPAARIARQSGMTTGEVELLRGLRRIGAK